MPLASRYRAAYGGARWIARQRHCPAAVWKVGMIEAFGRDGPPVAFFPRSGFPVSTGRRFRPLTREVPSMPLSRRSLLMSSAGLACGAALAPAVGPANELAVGPYALPPHLADGGTSLQPQDAAPVDPGNPRRVVRSTKWNKASEGFSHGQPDKGLLFSCKYGMTQGASLEERLAAACEAGMDGVDFDDAGAVTPAELRQAAATSGTFIHGTINHAHWDKRLTSPDPAVRAEGLANLEHCIRVSHAAGGSGVLVVIGRQSDGPAGAGLARQEISKAIPLAAALGQRILFENVWNGMFYEDDGPRAQSVSDWAAYLDSFRSPWVGAFFDLGNHARYGDVAAWIRELGPRIVKLDIKGYSNARADAEGKRKGFVDITAGDIDWPAVRVALADIGFTGWVSAEVEGGDVARLKVVLAQMREALLG
jgi:L-ribulose-5-phosphate 3-epimerase